MQFIPIGWLFLEFKRGKPDYWLISGLGRFRASCPKTGERHIHTHILRARLAEAGLGWAAAVAIPVLLVAPAIWNGYPLLQWDTGGYLARWYEGYVVPSRSTVFGLYLHFGEGSSFWINLGIQALATFWILQLVLRVLGMSEPLRLLGIGVALVLTTSLPWLSSMLPTDIFMGLSVLGNAFVCDERAAHGRVERNSATPLL